MIRKRKKMIEQILKKWKEVKKRKRIKKERKKEGEVKRMNERLTTLAVELHFNHRTQIRMNKKLTQKK